MDGVIDFDSAINHALQCPSCPKLTLKPEQRESVRLFYEGRMLFYGCQPDLANFCYKMLPFIFDVK